MSRCFLTLLRALNEETQYHSRDYLSLFFRVLHLEALLGLDSESGVYHLKLTLSPFIPPNIYTNVWQRAAAVVCQQRAAVHQQLQQSSSGGVSAACSSSSAASAVQQWWCVGSVRQFISRLQWVSDKLQCSSSSNMIQQQWKEL